MKRPCTRALRVSDRAYRVWLRTYPPAFRQRYGKQMREAFADLCRDAHRRGGLIGLGAVWAREVPGLVVGAVCERSAAMRTLLARRGTNRLAIVMIVDAVLLMAVGVALFTNAHRVLSLYGLVPAGVPDAELLAVKLTARTLGAVAGGLGGLILVVHRRIARGAPGQAGAPAATLAVIHAVTGASLAVSCAQYPSVLGWASVAVAAGLALAYLLVIVQYQPDPRPTGPEPAVIARRADTRRVA